MPLPSEVLLRSGRAAEPVDLRLRAGRVVEVAPRLEAEHGERVVDLGGRFVRHGLRDAHAHVVEWARSRRDVDLIAARTAEEAAALVGAAARRQPDGVLRGARFRDALWPDAPSRALLQAVAPDRVVVARSMDMHSAWLSPAALALAGLPDHPTGLLREHEAWQAVERLPVPTPAEDDAAVAEGVAAAHARGLTRLVDFTFEDAWAAWSRRALEAPLPLRVTCVVQRYRLPAAVERGLRTGDGDDRLRVGPVKLFMDGALGARTARCLHAYAGGHGQQLLDPDELREAVAQARAAGFTVAVHAIGDEATRDALRVLAERPLPGASVEHAQLLRREDLPLFAASGAVASVQPAHLLDDRDLVDDLWSSTPSIAYAGRSLLEAGAALALGSDAPVSPLDPWLGVAAAVHRTDGTRPAWHPEEALPLEAALSASGGRRLRAGDHADVVVVDAADPSALSAADLAAVPVALVLLDGQPVHDPGGLAG